MHTLLSNKAAIVTGSTKGIGLEIAKILLANGAKIAINSRRPSDVEAVVKTLGKDVANASVVGVPGDVGLFKDCERIVEKTVDEFGTLNILVNNAGVSMIHPSLTLAQADWQKTIDTNLSGVFYMSQLSAQKNDRKRRLNRKRVFYSGCSGVAKKSRLLRFQGWPSRFDQGFGD